MGGGADHKLSMEGHISAFLSIMCVDGAACIWTTYTSSKFKSSLENTPHLLIQCTFAHSIWLAFLQSYKRAWVMPSQ